MDQTDSPELPHHITVDDENVDTQDSRPSHQYRRYIIRCLQTADRPLMPDQLAIELTAWKHDKSVDQVSLKIADDLRMTLQEEHLPKLEDASIIAYDEPTGKLALTEQSTELTPISDGFTDQ